MILALLFLAQDLATLSREGAEAMRAQQYGRAVEIYRRLTVSDAANPMWRMNLGLALSYGGQHGEAVKELTAFVRLRPQPGPAQFVLGLSLLKLGRNCDAIPPLEAAQRWPGRPDTIWTELGDANHGCKRWEAAAKAYAEAGRLFPQERRIARQTARCWWLARRYDQAKPIYRSIEGSFQGDAEFLYEYGDTVMRLEGAAAGLPLLERSLSVKPGWPPTRGALGRALMELERPGDALAHLEAAAAEDVSLLLPLSRAYRALGRSREAARAEAEYKAKISTTP